MRAEEEEKLGWASDESEESKKATKENIQSSLEKLYVGKEGENMKPESEEEEEEEKKASGDKVALKKSLVFKNVKPPRSEEDEPKFHQYFKDFKFDQGPDWLEWDFRNIPRKICRSEIDLLVEIWNDPVHAK